MMCSARSQLVSASICALKAAWRSRRISRRWSKSRSFRVTFGSRRSVSVAQRPRVDPLRSNLKKGGKRVVDGERESIGWVGVGVGGGRCVRADVGVRAGG